ncbi:tapasin-like [Passer domesticus]|uniref:tapasin-like n=1 Tax=Passer domesticus TaxID=48849 RepID=UPI0030FDFE6A
MSPMSPLSPCPLADSTVPPAVSVFISTLTPSLRGLLGSPQTLHCSFGPAGGPFALRWLRHGRAGTRRLLAFDSAAPRATAAAPGTLLLLGGRGSAPGTPVRGWEGSSQPLGGAAGAGGATGAPPGHRHQGAPLTRPFPWSSQPPGGAMEVSLQLPPLSVSDDGSFVCSVTTPHGQVQQVLRMNVIGQCRGRGWGGGTAPSISQYVPVPLSVPTLGWQSSGVSMDGLPVYPGMSQCPSLCPHWAGSALGSVWTGSQYIPVCPSAPLCAHTGLAELWGKYGRAPSISQYVPVPLSVPTLGWQSSGVSMDGLPVYPSMSQCPSLCPHWAGRALGDAAGPGWSSGHRRGADGTFSRSAGLRVPAGTAGDTCSCLVTHAAWDRPHRVSVEVTGVPGPSVEDTAGVALVAFVIGGLCLRLWPTEGR